MQFSLDVLLPKFATFETFVDNSEGQLLSELKKLRKINLEEPQQYFIWGSSGTGKTHLLQSVCNQFANNEKNAIYLPMKVFVSQSAELLNGLQSMDVLCIDDIELVLGKEQWDRQLFHLINELRANNKSILMTSCINPCEAKVSLADLASRLVWGPVYRLGTLEDSAKSKAIQAHAQARGLEVSDEICNYLLKRSPRALNKLISLLDELDKQSLMQQRKVTIPFVKEVLAQTSV